MTTRSTPLTVLLTDPTGETSGLGLPPGSLVTGTHDGPWHEPLLWVADGTAVPGAWARYRSRSRSVRDAEGLQPVLLQDASGSEEWWGGELDPGMMSDPGDHRAEDVLRALWESAVIGPWLESPRLALVPVGRPADVPAAIGWSGPVNYVDDVARLCAVLRSWEDRFGARVVALSYARLDLSVAAPPRSLDEALAIAAEHFAFCPDNVWQGYESIRLYAEQALLGNAHWTFWWD
ncbi:DUF4253 domain-containing protein [Streptomyces sp. NPDC059496]|uniref:DUF4253 domain-containing protein n=1 Tax=Streptomyces sp. NPDC059496 TaxID=3346851 RepID=UPI0036ADD14E